MTFHTLKKYMYGPWFDSSNKWSYVGSIIFAFILLGMSVFIMYSSVSFINNQSFESFTAFLSTPTNLFIFTVFFLSGPILAFIAYPKAVAADYYILQDRIERMERIIGTKKYQDAGFDKKRMDEIEKKVGSKKKSTSKRSKKK